MAFGQALAEFIMKCEAGTETGTGNNRTELPKNFGPFYILAGTFPENFVPAGTALSG